MRKRQGRERRTVMERDQQHNSASQGGNKRKADGNPEFVANANAQGNSQRRKGKPPRSGGSGPSLEQLLNEPCPRHDTRERLATHLWKDCAIMKAFKNSNTYDGHNGSGGGSGAGGFHGPGGGLGSSVQGRQGGGYNQQQSGQGEQKQQSGYQSNPKQLNSG